MLPTRLGRSPVVEAVWEVRFQSDEQAIGELLVGTVRERMRADFDRVERLPASNLPPQIRERDTQLRYVPTIRLRGNRYTAAIGDHMVLIACARPYVGWGAFRPKIDELIGVLRDSGFLTRPERYGLKYVDILTHVTPPTLRSLSLGLRLGNTELSTEPAQIRFEIEREGFINVIQARVPTKVKFENEEEVEGLLVDVDTIRIWRTPEDAAGFWTDVDQNLERAHLLNKEIFFEEILTEETTRAHEPAYE